MKNNKKGFTLIELLVVIAIIGLLSTLAVIALNNARAKARDARRISDIKQMQAALELYYNDMNGYPSTLTSSTSIASDVATYMATLPANPQPNGIAYKYTSADMTTYTLEYELESGAGGLVKGVHTATESTIAR